MSSRTRMMGSIDGWLVFLYFFLVLFGWLNIYSSSFTEEKGGLFDFTTSHGKQLIWMGICTGVLIVIMLLDSRVFPWFAYGFYGFTLLLLVLVLIVGQEVDGNKAWFVITSSIKIQPSEFAKVSTALVLGKLISRVGFSFQPTSKSRAVIRDFERIPMLNFTGDGLLAFVAVMIPALMILLENDTGSTLVYASLILVFFRFGLSWLYLIWGVLIIVVFFSFVYLGLWPVFAGVLLLGVIAHILTVGVRESWPGLIAMLVIGLAGQLLTNFMPILLVILVVLVLGIVCFLLRSLLRVNIIMAMFIFFQLFLVGMPYVWEKVLKPHHRTRIHVLLGIEKDLKGSGWNVNNSKMAIASGGVLGKGFMRGSLTKLKFVPKQRTDFIFSTVGEEWGFWGSSLVIIIYLAFMIRLLMAAERQRSRFSMVYGYCVACVMFFHFFMNIGTAIGLAPAVGLPLPFFSYGGSSLLGFTILLWVFIKLDSQNMQILR